MIKINLKGEEAKGDTHEIVALCMYVASVCTLIFFFALAAFFTSSSIANLREENEYASTRLASLKEQTKVVRDLESKKSELMGITLAIAALKKSQEGPVHLLDDFNEAMPEKVWVKDIALRSGIMRIEGISLSDEALVAFIRQLEKSEYFEKVDLIDRTTVPLAQISTLNTADGKQTQLVVRGEKDQVAAKLAEIKAAVAQQGLEYQAGFPDNKADISGSAPGTSNSQSKLTFGASVRKTGGRPTVYAWENFERVKGEDYILEAKVRFTPRSMNLDLEKLAQDQSALPIDADPKVGEK